MIPKFKDYFYPFLKILKDKGCCRLYDLNMHIADFLKLTSEDLSEYTKGGSVSKHSSRVNYCASYLKKMGLVQTPTSGAYEITSRGKEVLKDMGDELSLSTLRNIPEFIATQVSAENEAAVYVKPHIRGGKFISAYVCNAKQLKEKNPNIEKKVINDYKQSLLNN